MPTSSPAGSTRCSSTTSSLSARCAGLVGSSSNQRRSRPATMWPCSLAPTRRSAIRQMRFYGRAWPTARCNGRSRRGTSGLRLKPAISPGSSRGRKARPLRRPRRRRAPSVRICPDCCTPRWSPSCSPVLRWRSPLEPASRGTPVLLQLFVLYYGLSSVVRLPAFAAAVLGLGLNYAAYESEIYRGALLAVARAQLEAARTLSLSELQILRLVRGPQALRLALAPMTNDFVALLKDSSLVSVITVVELTKE